MAPELFEGAYSETVDVYSFGMCVLEMVSKRMPYDECSNPAQLYRKVSSGVLPDAYHGIRYPAIQAFIRFCVERRPDGHRPSAADVEAHPFLNEEAPEDDEDDLMIPGEGGRVGGGAGLGAAGAGGAGTSRRKLARGSSIGEAAVSATPAPGVGDAGGSPPRVDSSPPAAASNATHFSTSEVYSGGDGGTHPPGLTVAEHAGRSPRRSSVSSDGDSGVGSGGDDMPGWEASPATEQQQGQHQQHLTAPSSLVDDDTPPASVTRSDPPATLSDLPVATATASAAAVATAPPLVDLCSLYDAPPPPTVGPLGHRRLSDALGLAADLPAAVDATSSPAVSALRDSPLAGAAAVSRTARASVASVRLQLTQRGTESASPLMPVGSSREFVSTGGGASHGSLQSMRGAVARRSLSHSSPPSAALLASVIAPSAATPMSNSPATTPLGDSGILFLCLEILHVQDDGNSAQATVTFGLDVTSNEVECAVEIVRSLRGLSLHVDDDTCVPMLAAFLNAQRAAPQVTITTGPIAKFNWQSLVLRQVVPDAQVDATSASSEGPNTASAPAASVRDAPGPETQGDEQPQRLLDGTGAPLPPGPISELVLDEGFGSTAADSAARPTGGLSNAVAHPIVAARDAAPGFALYAEGSTAMNAAYASLQRGALSDDVAGAAAGLVDEAPDAEFVASLGAERRQQLSQLGSVVLSGDEFAGSEGRRVSSASQLSLAESLSRADDSDSGRRPPASIRRASMRHDPHRDQIDGPGELSDPPYDETPTTVAYPDAAGVTSLYASDSLLSTEPNTVDDASLGDFRAYQRAEGADVRDAAAVHLLGAGDAYALGAPGGGARSALDLDDYGHDSSASFVAGLAEAYALTARAGQGGSFDGAFGARVGSSTGYLPAEYALAGGPAEDDVGAQHLADLGAIADSSRAEFHVWDSRVPVLATSSSITTGREFSDEIADSAVATARVHEDSLFPSRGEGGSAAAVFASPALAPAPAGGSYSAAPTPARIAAAFGDDARLDTEDAGDVLSDAGASLFSPSEAVAPAEGVLFSPVIAGTVGRGAASIVASDARH